MDTIILGDGGLGRAVEAAALERRVEAAGDHVRVLGRPNAGRHEPQDLAGDGVVVEASRADAVVANLVAAFEAGQRRFVIATTGWGVGRPRVESLLLEYGASGVASSNFSLGAVLFGRLVDAAVRLFGGLEAFDPYISSNGTVARSSTGHPAPRPISPSGSRPPIHASRPPATSRSSRSAPARHRGCTWSASMPLAKRSNFD